MTSIPLTNITLPSFTFLDRAILPKWYPTHDLHIVYIGEVLAATEKP